MARLIIRVFLIFIYWGLSVTFSNVLLAQTVEASFSFTENVGCQEQNLTIVNESSQGQKFDWDFCAGDFKDLTYFSSELTSLSNESFPTGIQVVNFQEKWYGFVVSRDNNTLIRLDFGSSLDSANPTVVEVGSNPMYDFIENLQFHIEGENVYAIALNRNLNILLLLNFENGIESQPFVSPLPVPGIEFSKARMCQFIQSNGDLLMFVPNEAVKTLVVVNFGSSILNTPALDDVYLIETPNSAHNIHAISVANFQGEWFGILSSRSSNEVFLIKFGTQILDGVQQFQLLASFDAPTSVHLISEFGQYYGLLISLSGEIYLYNFESGLGEPINSSNLSMLNKTGELINSFNFTLVEDKSTWRGYSTDFVNKNILLTEFTGNICSSSMSTSNELSPSPIRFMEEGIHRIGLSVTDLNGNVDLSVDSISINSGISPSADFILDENQCRTNVNSFVNLQGSLSYSWDFNNDGIEDSNLENPSYQFPAAGTYTVRLDVDDGTCGNFTEQEITIYEEPPAPSFQVNGLLCGSSEITFTNQTVDGSYAGPLTYEWDFNGEATASTKDATFTFGSGGQKIITLTSSIPGCENTTQQVINLVPGPTSLFSANSICAGELMTFTNQSAGADSYVWDFGDGFTSTQADVTHVYTEGGNFTVQLEATDTDGCSAIYEQEVAVSPTPVADFDFDIPCSGSQGIPFFDLSAVDGADILSWEWTIDGEVATTEQNPIISFDESGSHIIGLSVLSSNGCDASYTQTVDVLASPDPAFSVDVACQNLVTRFMDNTPVEAVVSRLWTIDGQTYTTQEVDFIFSESGTFDVSLTVTSDDFCSSTISSTVVVPAAPSMEFTISSLCSGDNILLDDTSIQGADPVVSRTWLLDGEPFFNGVQAQLTDLEPLSYEITLASSTQAGCMFSATQTANFLTSPEADFESSVNYGVPPFEVNFSNSSAGATSYSWLINGVEVSTSPDFTNVFSTEGNHTVELVIGNDNGCSDTQKINILSALPAINLQIDQVTLTPSGVAQTISLQVSNNGNLPVEIFDVIIRAGTDFSISERINQFLDIGEQTTVQLTSSLQSINADNICISIVSAYDDVSPDDNEECVSFSPTIILENPYPNPIDDEATIRLILPESSDVDLSIVNTAGKQMVSESYKELSTGLHVFRYDFSQFEKGLYFVTVKYQGKVVTKRILKF